MRASIKQIIKSHPKGHNREIERNILTFGICFVIATTLWFLNTLNKEYTTKISYPIKYTDLPKGKLLISDLPQKITLEIKAHGFALLRYKISTSFLPLVFNINTYTNGAIEKKDLLDYTVNLSEIKDKISAQLNNDLNLISIEPSSIRFRFSNFESKTVPVIPVVNYTLRDQYMLQKPITITPNQITISGPASLIDTLHFIYTEPIHLKNLSKNISKELTLQQTPGIQFENEEVLLDIQIERFTEAKKSIPLKIINLPDSLKLQLFPSSVDITFEVGLSRYDHIVDSSFILYVDYNQIKNSSTTIPIHLDKQPPFIQNISYTPGKVEYLIEKK